MAWIRTCTATHRGEFMGFAPTGATVTWQDAVFSEYNAAGKVVREYSVSDLYEALHQQAVAATPVEMD